MTLKITKVLFWLSIALFVACLPLNAYNLSGIHVTWSGLGILFFGWMGGPAHLANLAWWANPALFISWSYLARRTPRFLIFGVIAAVLVVLPLFGHRVVDNEGGVAVTLRTLNIGYWVWVAAVAMNLFGCIVLTMELDEQSLEA